MDWKEQLKTIKGSTKELNTDKKETTQINITKDIKTKKNTYDLIIRFEKRNGKACTIISNFNGNKQDLLNLAKLLKKNCSVGGSAKDDEILLQGDVRKKAACYLKNNNYKVRGDF